MSTTVATQGREASFHFVAARQYFGDGVRLISCATFREVLEHLRDCDYGVVAVWNSISGDVHEVGEPSVSVRELISSYGTTTVATLTLPIEQCLITLSGAKLGDITKVFSHDAALKQCSNFLQSHVPQAELVEHEDTAGAAADIQRWNNPHYAAIASRAAADLYGLQVAAAGIGNNAQSLTKFVVVRSARLPAQSRPKPAALQCA